MRLIAPFILCTVFIMSLALVVSHAQSTATTDQGADRSWAKYKGWTGPISDTQEHWGKLTDDDIQEIDGRRKVLIGKLETRYAISHEEAERQVDNFEAEHR